MLSQFFLSKSYSTTFTAWLGLLLVVGHSFFNAYLKYALNQWYERFYDVLQSASVELADLPNATASDQTLALEQEAGLSSSRAHVWSLLGEFCSIIAPALLVHPVARWVRSAWTFCWRMALIQFYTRMWDPNVDPVEGASQRLHEDTQRFASGVEVCLSTILDSVCTVAVFTPILLTLGGEVQCPSPSFQNVFGDGWLFASALILSLIHI